MSSRGSGNDGAHQHTIPVPGTQNGWSRSDNSILPIHFPPTSSIRSSWYGNPLPQPFHDWQPTHHFRTSSFQQAYGPRFVPETGGQTFQESVFVRRNAPSRSYPSEPYPVPPVHILLIGSMARESGPELITPFSSNLPPRFRPLQETVHSSRVRDDTTKLEQEKVVKMLKKQIYSSDPKSRLRRSSLYYDNMVGNGKESSDDDSKRCAVCLEDFKAGDEVMVTPCEHMFHGECIVPWMKSHGQCPVCRFVVSERIKADAALVSSNASAPPARLEVDGRFISDHVVSVIRAMDEAFSWVRSR
ncbi:hypothetical protein V2J09_006426 [Rumex salicifolius]